MVKKILQKLRLTKVDLAVLLVSTAACLWFIFQVRQAELMARMWQEASYLGPVPQVIINANTHKIVDINRAFENQLGWTKKEAVGYMIGFLLTPESMRSHRTYMSSREVKESLLHTSKVATNCRIRKSPTVGGGYVAAEVSIKGIDTIAAPYRWVVAITDREAINAVKNNNEPAAENGS